MWAEAFFILVHGSHRKAVLTRCIPSRLIKDTHGGPGNSRFVTVSITSRRELSEWVRLAARGASVTLVKLPPREQVREWVGQQDVPAARLAQARLARSAFNPESPTFRLQTCPNSSRQ